MPVAPIKFAQFWALTKPRVVALIVFTAIVGMLLATPGLPPLAALFWGSLGIWLAAASAAAINHLLDQRIDALMAALLRVKLPQLPAYTAARRENAARYDALFAAADLGPRLTTPARVEAGHVYNQYVIRTPKRDQLAAHLSQHGIETAIYYPKSLHEQGCFADLGYATGDFPESERASREVLALPIYGELPPASLERVADEVIGFLRQS